MADDIVYVDVNEGSKRVLNNTKLFVKLLGRFKEDKSIDNISAALESGDIAQAQIAAHTLKGLTANLSLSELYKQCVELEAQMKTGSVKDGQFEIVKNVYEITLTEVDKVITQYA